MLLKALNNASRVVLPTNTNKGAPSRPTTAQEASAWQPSRRDLLLAPVVLAPLIEELQNPGKALAIQGLTAGRIPGLSPEPNDNGFYTYTRPEGKSGGHGVGWSEIPRYLFQVPTGWEEIPVSIADLGGTEIDLRYTSRDQGDIAVVVAPVLRFADIGFNAQITIQQLGDPAKIIKGFGPELFGQPVEDEDILDTRITKKGSLTYYNYWVKPYRLVSATAFGNRMFIISVVATTRQWRKHENNLRLIADSFMVPDGTMKA